MSTVDYEVLLVGPAAELNRSAKGRCRTPSLPSHTVGQLSSARDVIDDLLQLIRTDLLDMLGPDPSGQLTAKDIHGLLVVYYRWQYRQIQPVPRTVHFSAELRADPRIAAHREDIDAIVAKIEAGASLTPHLSRGVRVRYQPTPPISRSQVRRDLDGLLADWGIHHLHLSQVLDPDGFATRPRGTEVLLFAAFTFSDAYLIGLGEHGDWTKVTLVETTVRNWPDVGIFRQLTFVVGLGQPVHPEARAALRGAGATAMIEVDAGVWTPQGVATDGHPIRTTMWADQTMNALRQARVGLGDGPDSLVAMAHEQGVALGEPPDWAPATRSGWYGLVDRTCDTFVHLAYLPSLSVPRP